MPSFAFDTSGFVNSWTKHYRLPVFRGVWDALAQAMDDGVVIAPTEVLVEMQRRVADGGLYAWANSHPVAFVAPAATWSPHLAEVQIHAPHWFAGTGDHGADPFVVALAMDRQIAVVTYEGQAYSGDPAKISTYKRSMPHVCASVKVAVASVFDVLDYLGVVLS